MALSGINTWTLTRNEIILAAMRKIGVINSLSTPETFEYTDAAIALNALVKEWSAEGAGLWLRQSTVLILEAGRQRYLLGPSGDHAFAQTGLATNKLAGNEASASTVMDIADADWVDYAGKVTAKPTSGNIGVRLDSGVLHWTTIAGVGANTVTLTAGLPSTAAVDSMVYFHADYVSRPLRVVSCHSMDTAGNAREVALIGRADYEMLSQKSQDGDPQQAHFDPQMTNACLLVWPVTPGSAIDRLVMTTEHYPDDFTSATDNPHFPSEWVNALIWGLAADLAPEYGIDLAAQRMLFERAEVSRMRVLNTQDRENASVTFGMSGS